MSIYPPPGEEETSPMDAKDSRGEGGGEKGGRVLVVAGLAGGLLEGGSTQAAGTGAMPCSLWLCQAFRERMEAIACQWRDLHIKEAQLEAYMKKSRRVLQVQLPLLSSASTTPGCTASSCPPLGRDPGGTAVCPHLH